MKYKFKVGDRVVWGKYFKGTIEKKTTQHTYQVKWNHNDLTSIGLRECDIRLDIIGQLKHLKETKCKKQ